MGRPDAPPKTECISRIGDTYLVIYVIFSATNNIVVVG